MDSGDAILAVIAVTISGMLAVTFGIGWYRASRRVRALERRLDGVAPDTVVADLENHLAVLSDQVDQIANGQDFLSRLLTEQRVLPVVRPELTPR